MFSPPVLQPAPQTNASQVRSEVDVWRPATVPWKSVDPQKGTSGVSTGPSPDVTGSHSPKPRRPSPTRDTNYEVGRADAQCSDMPMWKGPPLRTSSATSKGEDGHQATTAPSMDERWENFQRIARASEAIFRTTMEASTRSHSDVAAQQKELAGYQETQRALASQQQQRLDSLTRECVQLRQSEAGMREVIAHQADRLAALENAFQTTNAQLGELRLTHAQCVEERNKLQDVCKMHEAHTRELQAALEFSDEIVRSMRQAVAMCERDKDEALMSQYTMFETYRNDLIVAYDKRAAAVRDEFVTRVESLQASMLDTVSKREEQLKATWEETQMRLRGEYDELVKIVQKRRAAMDTELRERKEELEREKEHMRAQQREEMTTLEQHFRLREETLLDDITRRERELRERESALRAAQAQQEVDVQRRLQTRETELRAAHDAALQRITEQAAGEREKLSESYMERLQQLSNAHMEQERELERMHREKEREMAQRYRLTALDGSDRGDVRDRRIAEGASASSESAREALLRKFESVEQRQRERCEKLRSVFSARADESQPPP